MILNKFRIWSKDTNCMIPFEKLHIELKDGEYTVRFSLDGGVTEYVIPIENLTSMAYSGFKDKKGKEIYDGDILEYESGYRDSVIFIDGCFITTGESTFDYLFIALKLHDAEVVGNIYENLELLK